MRERAALRRVPPQVAAPGGTRTLPVVRTDRSHLPASPVPGPGDPAPWPRRIAAYVTDLALFVVPTVAALAALHARQTLRQLWRLYATKQIDDSVLHGHHLADLAGDHSLYLQTMGRIMPLLAVGVLGCGSWLLYRVASVAGGRGIGKRLFRLKVVDVATGRPPGRMRALRRALVPQGFGLLPVPATGLLAYVTAFADPQRRGLHDRAAGTCVITDKSRRSHRNRT